VSIHSSKPQSTLHSANEEMFVEAEPFI